MSHVTHHFTRIASFVAAVLLTAGVQGVLLAGFDHLADHGASELANSQGAQTAAASPTPGATGSAA